MDNELTKIYIKEKLDKLEAWEIIALMDKQSSVRHSLREHYQMVSAQAEHAKSQLELIDIYLQVGNDILDSMKD